MVEKVARASVSRWLTLALSRCSWPYPRAFASAHYANQARFPCIARRHRSIECWIRAVLIRCWKDVHFLSAAWHFRSVHGRLHVNKRFAASAVTCTILQLRTSSEKKTKFVGNKTVIYGRNRSSLCLIFVKLARLCVFSSFIRPITYERASREHAFDASGNAKPEL